MPPKSHNGSRTNQEGWSKNIEMEDIDSSGSVVDRSQTPVQSDFTKNPPLNSSRHNPENGFFKAFAEILANRNSDGSIFIQPDKVNSLLPLFEIEKIASVQTLSLVEKITVRLDSFERSLNSVVNSSSKSSSAWVSVKKKGAPTIPIPQSIVSRPPPSTRILNEFKSAFFVIRKTTPDSRPFFQLSVSDITDKVNEVLKDIEAKTDDGEPISVKGAARLPSGDFKFFTQTRFAANWLLEHKHEWTHLCDPSLVTPPSKFPVILHSVPISFTPTNPSSLSDLCKENHIHPEHIHSARWLGNPQANKKSHGSIIVNFREKELAKKIEKGSLFFNRLCLTGAHYQKSPIQCFQCLEVGHTAQFCKNTPLCKHCGDSHNSIECGADISNNNCVKCIQYEKKNNPSFVADVDNVRFNHLPMSLKCPLKTKNFRRIIINQ
jgi:hypothetical protein